MPTFKSFKDSRDGRIYKCVLMPDGKWWSAENLAWDGAGRFYNDDSANGPIYGRLYLGSEVDSAIPSGTHLPTYEDFYNLVELGSSETKAATLWVSPGTDSYGFSALPSGEILGSEMSVGIGSEFKTWGSAPSWSTSVRYYCNLDAYSTISNYYSFAVRFIVDKFPVEFPSQQITSVSNLQINTANSQFRGESGLYRTVGSQGLPVVTANITWDCTEDEVLLFDEWFDPEVSWTHEGFPGLGNVEIQARGLPKKIRTYSGVEISLDVTLFLSTSSTITFPSFPTLVSYTGVESGYNFVDNKSVVTTSGRTSLRTPTGKRGETYSISWKTSQSGAIQFLQWYMSVGNGRKQFLASICGKVGWLWKIVQAPSFTLDVDMVKISMSIDGRDVRRSLPVSIVKDTVTKITGAFSGSGVRAFFYSYIPGVTVELPLSSQSTTSLTVAADFITIWGPYLGNVRILIVDGEYISEWKDSRL